MTQTVQIKWLSEPEAHDYPAARSYLSLIFDEAVAERYTQQLESAKMDSFKAKDIFRASGLSLLGVSNGHVENDRNKIAAGASVSPLLLVRASADGKVIIADGYHRLCAAYSYDEDTLVPCKIV
jgi:hypothetical protein